MAWPALAAIALVGCAGGGGDDGVTGNSGITGQTGTDTATSATATTGPDTASGTTDGSASGTSTTTTAGTDATSDTDSGAGSTSTTGGPKFDLGVLPDSPPPPEGDGCEKVDFLFVIDNSGSMADEQTNLVNNFPGFITGIQSTLGDVSSYHVGVVTTDEYSYNIAGCQTLGSLVAQTGGSNSSNATCGPFMDGYNFMTETDDLGTAFTCAADVGTAGDFSELPMQALRDVANEVDAGVGECNEMFLRPDSLLVVVVLTDEADGPDDGDVTYFGRETSPGTPLEWFDDVVAARGGIEENVVVMSLINYYGGPCPPDQTEFVYPEMADGKNIKEFTEMFTHGIVGGVCEADYGPYFQQAIGVIDSACDNFQPPG